MEQLNESRLRQWHQQGEALLTFENLRSWINATGLVLFTSRANQLPAPAPTFVEAVLGATNANPVLADLEQAKSLLARLVLEGVAVPLNLLGTAGECAGLRGVGGGVCVCVYATPGQGVEAAAADERRA